MYCHYPIIGIHGQVVKMLIDRSQFLWPSYLWGWWWHLSIELFLNWSLIFNGMVDWDASIGRLWVHSAVLTSVCDGLTIRSTLQYVIRVFLCACVCVWIRYVCVCQFMCYNVLLWSRCQKCNSRQLFQPNWASSVQVGMHATSTQTIVRHQGA